MRNIISSSSPSLSPPSLSTPSWVINDLDLQLIDLALIEDLGFPYNDVTTNTLFSAVQGNFKANIISKHHQPIIICGLPVIKSILAKFDTRCDMHSDYDDGQILSSGAILLTLTGPASALLMIERTVLNFLQRLTAIATLTAKFVNAIKHTTTQILDTRKTHPGSRHLEKYAVHCGGGVNHRMGLYDAMMIKDTHIDFLGGIKKALNLMPATFAQKIPVIVEVRNLDELNIVVEEGLHKVTRVLLDNMTPALMSECVALCNGKIATEASGDINIDNINVVAECGVNFASIGQLTHSAGCVDLSMKCEI